MIIKLWNKLINSLTDKRRKKDAKAFVEFIMPSKKEVQGVKLSDRQHAFSFADTRDSVPRPESEMKGSYGYIVSKIGQKRQALGYNDREPLVFTVPVMYACADGQAERIETNIKGSKFKRFKKEDGTSQE